MDLNIIDSTVETLNASDYDEEKNDRIFNCITPCINFIISVLMLYHNWLGNKMNNSENIKNRQIFVLMVYQRNIYYNNGSLITLKGRNHQFVKDSLQYHSSRRTEMEHIMSKCIANNNESDLCLYDKKNNKSHFNDIKKTLHKMHCKLANLKPSNRNDVNVLDSTIKLLNEIGFRPPSNQSTTKTPKYTLFFSDLKQCNEIKWWFDFQLLQRKETIHLSRLSDEFYNGSYNDINKWIIDIFDYLFHTLNTSRGNICIKDKGKELLDEIDYFYHRKITNNGYGILIIRFFNGINSYLSLSNKIYKICIEYYHSPIDLHKNMTHLSYLSMINNKFFLNAFDMKNILNVGIDTTTAEDISEQNVLFMITNTNIHYKNAHIRGYNLIYAKTNDYDKYLIINNNKSENLASASGIYIVSEMCSYSISNSNILCIDGTNETCDDNVELDEYNKMPKNGKHDTIVEIHSFSLTQQITISDISYIQSNITLIKTRTKAITIDTVTSSSNPYEIIVNHSRKQSKYMSNGSNMRHLLQSDSRRYLNITKSMNISQSSSPTIKHKLVRNNNSLNYKSLGYKSYINNYSNNYISDILAQI